MFQSRDSSLGMLIASGMFCRHVPGSPAIHKLGARGGFLKLHGQAFQQFSELFERGREIVRYRRILCSLRFLLRFREFAAQLPDLVVARG